MESTKISKDFLNTMGIFPADMVQYLPLGTQEFFQNAEQINGNYYLPKEEAFGLLTEAQAEKMGRQALRNDPHGRGFHNGNPEFKPALTTNPEEMLGREFKGPNDLYGSRPNIYRSVLPFSDEKSSPIFYGKYAGKNVGVPEGRKNQYTPLDPEQDQRFKGSYDSNLDEIVLVGNIPQKNNTFSLTENNQAKSLYPNVFKNKADEVEAHEYIHRGIGTELPLMVKALGKLYGNNTVPQGLQNMAALLSPGFKDANEHHEYIHESFTNLDPYIQVEKILTEHLQKKEQADVMKNMSRFQKDYYISEERKKIIRELGL